MTDAQLPIPVLEYPYWRVNIRSTRYEAEALPSLAACFDLIEKTKLSLRGWDYPHLSRRVSERGQGANWIASWSDFMTHYEYWRLYQSGQFYHLFRVAETDQEWRTKLIGTMGRVARLSVPPFDPSSVPGFFHIPNFIFTITEIFEFAARLASSGHYGDGQIISVHLFGIEGFMLAHDLDRAWSKTCRSSQATLGHEWSFATRDLIAQSATFALNAIGWFFERFGWMSPSLKGIQQDQENFLAGRF